MRLNDLASRGVGEASRSDLRRDPDSAIHDRALDQKGVDHQPAVPLIPFSSR